MKNLTKEIQAQRALDAIDAEKSRAEYVAAFKAEMKKHNPFAKQTFNLTRQIELREIAPELAEKLQEDAERGDDLPGRLSEVVASIDELKQAIDKARGKGDGNGEPALDLDVFQRRLDAIKEYVDKSGK